MFRINEQLPIRTDRREDGAVMVHSHFHTIQGEGPFAGESAFFIRLFGCNLQCPGCDTDYTSKAQSYTPDELVALVKRERSYGDLIVITGGEPFRQNIAPLVEKLAAYEGYRVQIETNGVLFLPGFPYGDENVTIVCSPKTPRIHPETAKLVDAYKYVMRAGHVAEDGLPTDALAHDLGNAAHVARPPEGWEGPVFLQPMDEQDEVTNKANAQACAESVLNIYDSRYGAMVLGFQMHKYIDLP